MHHCHIAACNRVLHPGVGSTLDYHQLFADLGDNLVGLAGNVKEVLLILENPHSLGEYSLVACGIELEILDIVADGLLEAGLRVCDILECLLEDRKQLFVALEKLFDLCGILGLECVAGVYLNRALSRDQGARHNLDEIILGGYFKLCELAAEQPEEALEGAGPLAE